MGTTSQSQLAQAIRSKVNSEFQLSLAGGGGSDSSSDFDTSSSFDSSSDWDSDSSSSSGGSGSLASGIVSLIIFGVIVAIIVVVGKRQAKKQGIQQAATQEKLLENSGPLNVLGAGGLSNNNSVDADPNQRAIRDIFINYENDWGALNTANFASYMTPRYQAHATLLMRAFADAKRRNPVVVNAYYGARLMGDYAEICANANDILLDTRTNQIMYENDGVNVDEYWRFSRSSDGKLLLDGIEQPTADLATRERGIQAFAQSNGAYYSLDFGRLLLPTTGVIFQPDSFQRADVNNHVIGQMGDTGHLVSDSVVYQIYTYSALPYRDKNAVVYLVGQLAVPKDYGRIVIVRNHGILTQKPHGLNELQTESGDFNKNYRVFASNAEQVTSFELLNPQMIETLTNAPFEINIEVIDNVIYFFAQLHTTNASNYAAMLSILQSAYRELKM